MVHQKLKDLFVAEVPGDGVRRALFPQSIEIDRAAATRIPFREKFLGDTHADAVGIGIKMASHEREIAQGSNHENVSPATTGHQKSRNVLAVAGIMPCLHYAQHMLRRCGLM